MFVELKLDRYDVYKLETRTEQSAWIYSQDQFLRMHPRELKIVFSFFQMDLLLVLLLLLVFKIPRNHLHSRWLLLFPRSRCLQTLSSTTWSLSQEIYVQRDAPILISRFKLSSILNAMLLPHTTMKAFFFLAHFDDRVEKVVCEQIKSVEWWIIVSDVTLHLDTNPREAGSKLETFLEKSGRAFLGNRQVLLPV